MLTIIVKQTKGKSWQGVALDPPEHVPKSVWHGSPEKVKEAYTRYAGPEVRFISLNDDWDKIYE